MNQNCSECERDYKEELNQAAQQIEQLKAREAILVESLIKCKEYFDFYQRLRPEFREAIESTEQALTQQPDVEIYRAERGVIEAAIDFTLAAGPTTTKLNHPTCVLLDKTFNFQQLQDKQSQVAQGENDGK